MLANAQRGNGGGAVSRGLGAMLAPRSQNDSLGPRVDVSKVRMGVCVLRKFNARREEQYDGKLGMVTPKSEHTRYDVQGEFVARLGRAGQGCHPIFQCGIKQFMMRI